MEIRDLKQTDFNDVNEIFKQIHELHVKHRPDIYRNVETPPKQTDILRRKF